MRCLRPWGHNCMAVKAKTTVFILAAFDFDFLNQRPRELALELVKLGYKIIYINPQRVRPDHLNEQQSEERIHPDFWLIKPVITKDRDENKRILADSIKDFAQRHRLKEYNLWLSSPYDVPVIGRAGEKKVLYECLDDTIHDKDAFYALRKTLLGKCDVLIKSSRFLLPGHRGFISSQGVDVERFRPRQTFGFYGLIGPWIDFSIIRTVAEKNPESEVRLIGPVNTRVPTLPTNVALMPAQDYHDLPFILKGFDVCLIPNKTANNGMEQFLRGRHPIKVYEYLAAGKPVVAANLPSLQHLSQFIYLAETPDQFAALCRTALSEHSAEKAEQRMAAMSRESWARQAERLDKYLTEQGYFKTA